MVPQISPCPPTPRPPECGDAAAVGVALRPAGAPILAGGPDRGHGRGGPLPQPRRVAGHVGLGDLRAGGARRCARALCWDDLGALRRSQLRRPNSGGPRREPMACGYVMDPDDTMGDRKGCGAPWLSYG